MDYHNDTPFSDAANVFRSCRKTVFLLSFLFSLILGQVCLVSPSAAQERSLADIIYLTEEYYPYNYTENGTLKGLAVELLKQTWDQLGIPHQPITSLPWARAYQRLRLEPFTMLFCTARTVEREKEFLWAGPIRVVRFVLIAKKERGITMKNLCDLAGLKVGTLRDDVTDTLMQGYRDVARVEPVADMQLNVDKLMDDRLDLVAYEERSWHKVAERNGLERNDFETVIILRETPIFYAFHRTTPPIIVRTFQSALDRVKAGPAYQKLLNTYLD
jgi:polar amino acid transport system substrate-binding protein